MRIIATAFFICLATATTAFAANPYVVSEKTSDGFLLQDEIGNFWYVTTYSCYPYEGDIVFIDSYFGPSSYDEIIVPQTYGDPDTCNIDEAHEVTHKARISEELDDDKIILTLDGQDYLVEYGIGCGLSIWRYEGDDIYLKIGGAFLNGIGDRMILPNGRDCRIWDAREIEGSSGYSGGGYTDEELLQMLNLLEELNNSQCPANSSNIGGTCYCNSGYQVNDDKTGCVKKTEYSCPENSQKDPEDETKCICIDGYMLNSKRDGCMRIPGPQQATSYRPKDARSKKQSFYDVPPEHHAYSEIEYLHEKGILDGYEDGSFKPGDFVNRAELLKILIGGLHSQELKGETGCFPDVNNEWFAKYVCAAKRLGWVDGYSDGTFQPSNTVNRAEAIKIIVSSVTNDLNSSESLNTDVKWEDWFSPYTRKALELGIEESRGMFYPSEDLTRYGAATWIYNAIKK